MKPLGKRLILRLPEAAVLLGMSEGALSQAIRRGQIPVRKWGRRRVILLEELKAHFRALPLLQPHDVFQNTVDAGDGERSREGLRR